MLKEHEIKKYAERARCVLFTVRSSTRFSARVSESLQEPDAADKNLLAYCYAATFFAVCTVLNRVRCQFRTREIAE